MIEIILVAILLVLVIILMMLRAWFPRMSQTWVINSDSYEKRIDVDITLRRMDSVNESYTFTSLGMSKNFTTYVLFETSYLLGKDEDSNFHHGELNVMSIENLGALQHQDESFIITFRNVNDKLDGTSSITLMCTIKEYEFLKDQLKSNKFMTLNVDNGKKIELDKSDYYTIKGRLIGLNLFDSLKSTHSIKRFVKRYIDRPEMLSNSYLSEWLEYNKEIID